jgi:hypothetical protein
MLPYNDAMSLTVLALDVANPAEPDRRDPAGPILSSLTLTFSAATRA